MALCECRPASRSHRTSALAWRVNGIGEIGPGPVQPLIYVVAAVTFWLFARKAAMSR